MTPQARSGRTDPANADRPIPSRGETNPDQHADAPRARGAGPPASRHTVQVAAWRELWRLLLQPPVDEPMEKKAASDQKAAGKESHDGAVHLPRSR